MSFIEPQVKKRILDVNAEIAELKGSLSDKETKIYLAKFLIHNLSFTFKLLTGAGGDGVELYPFQELLLRMLFEKDNVLCVMGRGTGKTWIAAVFIIL